MNKGPLAGAKIIELAGIGPGPMCAMTLADLGATVLRIDRPTASDLGIPRPVKFDLLMRNRRVIRVDLKKPEGVEFVLKLVEDSDALIEGFRPGVTERLGLGPDVCLARNPKLVYGRMTGWGQTGPYAKAAGHDMNYIALTGALAAIGRAGQPPTPPLNFIGDYVGAMYLGLGMTAAMWEAKTSGKGQVVDAAMCDTSASFMTNFYGLFAAGMWSCERGTNILDSGAPFFDVYECKDGKWLSVAPIEAKFYEQFLRIAGIDPASMKPQNDRQHWAGNKVRIAAALKQKTRDEWAALYDGTDACVSPVLDFTEAPQHPHFKARQTFAEIDGVMQPMPSPRFSRTPPGVPTPPDKAGNDEAHLALAPWNLDETATAALKKSGVLV